MTSEDTAFLAVEVMKRTCDDDEDCVVDAAIAALEILTAIHAYRIGKDADARRSLELGIRLAQSVLADWSR